MRSFSATKSNRVFKISLEIVISICSGKRTNSMLGSPEVPRNDELVCTVPLMATNELTAKLRPDRFSGMSGKMAAIVGCILGEDFTEPSLVELLTTSDGFFLGREGGDIGFNAFLGSVSDLRRNWQTLLEVAGLTDGERQEAERLYAAKVA